MCLTQILVVLLIGTAWSLTGRLIYRSSTSCSRLVRGFSRSPSSFYAQLRESFGTSPRPTPSQQPVNEPLSEALQSSDDQFVKYMYRLAHRSAAHGKNNLSSNERRILLRSIEERIPTMQSSNLATMCWSLGTLRLPLRASGMLAVTDFMLERLDDCSEQLATSPKDLTHTLVGLGRMNLMVRLSKDSFLNQALPSALAIMDAQNVANSVWSLGKLGIAWDEAPLKIRRAIAESVARVASAEKEKDSFTPQGIANAVFGLSQLRAKWNYLPQFVTKAIVKGLSRSASKMNEQELSNTLSGLGRLGAEWVSLPLSLRESLSTALYRNLRDLSSPMVAQGLAMSVHGLGRMNADFQTLPAPLRRSLYRAIIRCAPQVNDIETSNLLYGMGKMGCPCSSTATANTNTNVTGLVAALPKNPDDIPTSTRKVDHVQVKAPRADPAAKRQQQKKFRSEKKKTLLKEQHLQRQNDQPQSESLPYATTQDTAQLQGDASEALLSSLALSALLEATTRESWRFAALAVSNSLWGLMLMGVSWDSVPHTSQQAILRALQREASRFDEQEASNVLYALGTLGCPWGALTSALQSELLAVLEVRADELKPAGVAMTLLGLSKAGLFWNQYPDVVREGLSAAAKKALRTHSQPSAASSDHGSGVAALLHALSTTRAQWAGLEGSLQVAITEAISRSFWTTELQTKSKALEHAQAPTQAINTHQSQTRSQTQNQIPTQPQTQAQSLTLASLIDMGSSSAAALLLSGISTAAASSTPTGSGTSKGFAPASFNQGHARGSQAQSHSQLQKQAQAQTQEQAQLQAQAQAQTQVPLRITPRLTRVDLLDSFEVATTGHTSRARSEPTLDTPQAFKPQSQSQIKAWSVATHAADSWLGLLEVTPPSASSLLLQPSTASHRPELRNPLVLSLARLGASWDGLPTDTKQALSSALVNSLNPRWEAPGYLHLGGVLGVLEGLSSLGATWEGLPLPLRGELRQALRRTAGTMDASAVASTILHLSELEVPWADLEGSAPGQAGTLAALRHAIIRQASYGPEQLSRLLLGLGKMRRWSDLHADVRQALKAALVESQLTVRASSNPAGVVQTLEGLAAMSCSWAELSTSVRLSLLRSISRALPVVYSSQLVSVLSSLGAMKVALDSLPVDLQSVLLDRLGNESRALQGSELVRMLDALVGLQVDWVLLPAKVQEGIYEGITASLVQFPGKPAIANAPPAAFTQSQSQLEPQQSQSSIASGALVLAMGRLGLTWTRLPANLFSALQTAFVWCWDFDSKAHARSHANKQQRSSFKQLSDPLSLSHLSSWLGGLAKMGVRYAVLSLSAQAAMVGVLPYMAGAGLAQPLEKVTRNSALSVSSTAASGEVLSDLSLALNSLGVSGVSSLAIDETARQSVVQAAERVCASGEPVDVAAALLGLALMDFSWGLLTANTRSQLLAGVLRVANPRPPATLQCKREAFWLLHAPEEPPQPAGVLLSDHRRAARPCSFSQLDSAAMCPSACASIMHSLSLLAFDAPDPKQLYSELLPVHSALLLAVESLGPERFSEREKENILAYAQLISSVSPPDATAHGTAQRCLLRADPVVCSPELCGDYEFFTSSAPVNKAFQQRTRCSLQQSVVASLASALQESGLDASIKLSQDFSPFSGALPVDATIYDREGGNILAFLEVDGPHHYTSVGSLRREDQLKEVLYKRAHPGVEFARVNFEQVAALGTTTVGLTMANYLAIIRNHATPTESSNSSGYDTSDSLHVAGWARRRAAVELRSALSLKSGRRKERHQLIGVREN